MQPRRGWRGSRQHGRYQGVSIGTHIPSSVKVSVELTPSDSSVKVSVGKNMDRMYDVCT